MEEERSDEGWDSFAAVTARDDLADKASFGKGPEEEALGGQKRRKKALIRQHGSGVRGAASCVHTALAFHSCGGANSCGTGRRGGADPPPPQSR